MLYSTDPETDEGISTLTIGVDFVVIIAGWFPSFNE